MVDAARAFSIVVVTVWHWTLSVIHRTAEDGLAMPNPIDAVPGGWLATWVLQIMPVFFLVGGYANLAGWERAQASGSSSAAFVGVRLRRLLTPTLLWVAVWLAAELVAALLPGPHRWIWEWFPGFLVPLWFLGVYGLLIVAVPVTAKVHARVGVGALAGLAGLIAVGDVLHRAADVAWAAWVTTAAVWLFCHQLGYFWRTHRLGARPLGQRLGVAAVGLAVLVALTMIAGYPRPMVATVGEPESNMFPTTAAIAALAVFQLGLLALLTPAAGRLLRRAAVWKLVVSLNLVAITVFLWHMTALLVVVLAYEGLGHTLLSQPTGEWWGQRWLWLLAPAIVLGALVAAFGRVEIAARRPRRWIR
ncbi:acyltransferase family protein [Blastococcus sp. KM273129]|uniref:acyltransferase family protein n=1 Tax=Blastococcus sp. KM273129 TaxID=2570315 RepID=UPI001F3F7509|nr:acyltransferase family protein [Blastococcus sp. KM273129]MCF6737225.1 acyltransferase [Blastococcus sp. KM273129]